ncbi:MAG: cation transporter [Anaerolineales bacterium]|nr:cation transporter [Anaerolineales bacterium]
MSGKCHVDAIQKVPSVDEQRNANVVTLNLWGVGCSNCATRVRNRLILLTGVLDVYVDHLRSHARVVFNPDLVAVSELVDAVRRAGSDGMHEYRAEVEEIREIP